MTTDLVTWLIFAAVVLGCAVVGFRMLRDRMDQMRMEEQLAEMEFQQSVLGSIGVESTLGDDDRFLQTEPTEADIKTQSSELSATEPDPTAERTETSTSPGTSADAIVTPQVQNDGPRPADISASSVVRQLTISGLLRGIDGYVPLHGNPRGAVLLRLRNGKQALLVPHMESEAFLRHNARRAELIIMVGTDGKAVTVQPLEQFLAEAIST